MGKKKIALVDLSEKDKVTYKASGTRSQKLKKQKQTKLPEKPKLVKPIKSKTEDKKAKKRIKHIRSKKYKTAKSKIDKSKILAIKQALKLLREISIVNFNPTIELNINLQTDSLSGELNLPHGNGKKQKIEIASESTLVSLKNGNADFDILISEPRFMPKLAKYGKLLGPKGLMPNPKDNTITDDPKKLKKKLEKGVINYRSEKKAPILHLTIGKLSFKDKQLQENIEAVIKEVKIKNIKSIFICSSMSPSIRLNPSL